MTEEVTFEEVMDRMLARIDDSFDKRESSPIYAALAPAALEIVNLYAALEDEMDEAYADTASREYLIRIAASRGIYPAPASHAVVKAEVKPAALELEIGAEFTSDREIYRVTEKADEGIYCLECKTAGEIGNLSSGELLPVDYIMGLASVKIKEILIYGEEEEDTEAFRTRYLDSFRASMFGGNRMDYEHKAAALPGVGAVKVIPVWNGTGTVKLLALDSNFRRASDELTARIQEAFDPDQNGMGNGLAPIGHIVTADTVEEAEVQIKTELAFDSGYSRENCKEAVEAAIEAYFSDIRKGWSRQEGMTVYISNINRAILSVPGILDVTGTLLNGTDQNLSFSVYELPVLGGVSYE